MKQPARTRAITYVCPVCNIVVANPLADPKRKNVLKCPSGHRVHERASSLFNSVLAGVMAGALLYSLSYFLPGLTPYLLSFSWAFRWTTAIWALWLISKGIFFATKKEPARGLGFDNIGLGAGFLGGLLFAGLALLATEIHSFNQPLWRTLAQVAVNVKR